MSDKVEIQVPEVVVHRPAAGNPAKHVYCIRLDVFEVNLFQGVLVPPDNHRWFVNVE